MADDDDMLSGLKSCTPFGAIVLALMISCRSGVRRRLSHRLCMVSSGRTVTSASEWQRLLKCSAKPTFSCWLLFITNIIFTKQK